MMLCVSVLAHASLYIESGMLQGVSSQVGNVGYWGSILTYAIRTGFCGALSTVSTFVAEVQPRSLHESAS